MKTLRNMFVSVFVFAPIVAAQLHVGGLTTDPGAPVDFSASMVTTPTGVGNSLPGTCTVGQQFFKSNNSAGTELYLCTATNTWTQIAGGGGGMIDPGANGVIKRTSLNTTAAATATDVSALTYVAGSGAAQAQVATLATPIASLTNGLNVCWLPAAGNTGPAPTLAVNGLTPKPLTKYGNAPLVANDLATTAIACAVYDGTEFQLQNPQTLPVFVKINGGVAVGPQTTLNLIPGTGLSGFTGIINGSQIDVTLPIDTAYLNTNYARVAAPNTYSGGLQDMSAVDLRVPVHSSDPGACSVGQIEFNSTGPTFKGCATANIWSTLGSGGSGGGGGVTTGSNGVAVSGTNATLYDLTKIYIREDFACKAQAISGVASASCNQGFYNLTNINGSGALTVQASTTNMVGAWRISSGATSGNDSTLNHLDWGSPFFPHPSATPYTFETRFALGTDTNDYQALGITESVSTSLSGNITKRAMWCDVTDTASQGTWQCYTCDGTATTTVTLSPTQTADLNPHVIGIQYTNTLVMFFFDGTQVGTSSTRIEAGGNGLVTPIWETKTSTTSAASMIVDAWRFFQ